MNDVELTEALTKKYTNEEKPTTKKVAKKTVERVEKAVTEYMPKRELYEIRNGLDLVVEYKKKSIYVGNVDLGVCIPFGSIPSLIHFLGWLVDSGKIDKE